MIFFMVIGLHEISNQKCVLTVDPSEDKDYLSWMPEQQAQANVSEHFVVLNQVEKNIVEKMIAGDLSQEQVKYNYATDWIEAFSIMVNVRLVEFSVN